MTISFSFSLISFSWYIHIDVDHSIIIYRNTKNMLPAKVDTNVKFKSRNTSITDKYE